MVNLRPHHLAWEFLLLLNVHCRCNFGSYQCFLTRLVHVHCIALSNDSVRNSPFQGIHNPAAGPNFPPLPVLLLALQSTRYCNAGQSRDHDEPRRHNIHPTATEQHRTASLETVVGALETPTRGQIKSQL